MAVKAYSVGCRKKNVPIVKNIKVIKRLLPNGNVVTIVKGESSKCGIVATIVENKKPKPCQKTGAKRTRTGTCTGGKKKKTAKKATKKSRK